MLVALRTPDSFQTFKLDPELKLMDIQTEKHRGVDKGLVTVFLKMSPEARLESNDNASSTILELRNAYKQQKINKNRS